MSYKNKGRKQSVIRLFTGVVLELVAIVVLKGVDVLATEMFSGSESESWSLTQVGRFLLRVLSIWAFPFGSQLVF